MPRLTLVRRSSRAQATPTLEEEKTALLALTEQEEGFEYDIGAHYNVIVDSRLWRQGPYKSAADFIRKVVKAVSVPEIWLYGSIARHFTREIATRCGITKLGSLLTYATLLKLELPADPSNVPIVVPRKEGGTIKKKFSDCTRTELRAAIRRARGLDDHDEQMPPEDAREVESLRTTFTNATGHNSPARFQAIYRNGMTLVSLEHLPVQYVWQICQALGHPPQPPPDPDSATRVRRRRRAR